VLKENRGYIEKNLLENRLLFMRTDEAFITHEWKHGEFYKCRYIKKEKGIFHVGSISIFHSMFSVPDFSFVSIHEDYDVLYKNMNKVPNWFQTLAKKTKEEHHKLVRELVILTGNPVEKYKALSSAYLSDDLEIVGDVDFLYDAQGLIQEYK